MEQYDMDAYDPAQMAVRVEKAGIAKSNRDFFSTFTLAMMAGLFIGLGAAFFTYVIHDSTLSVGLTKLIGGFVFSLEPIRKLIREPLRHKPCERKRANSQVSYTNG